MMPRMAAGTATSPDTLIEELRRVVRDPARLLTRPIDRVAFASDASFYRLIPQAVVLADGCDEIRDLFALSRRRRIPLTFRAAGTSLSGQALSDGILVEVARHWREATVEQGGQRVRVQPGIIGARVNEILRPHNARIGPDPASIRACTLGGILANNSSGMCCGVTQNAYHTLQSMTFLLPSGTRIDSAAPDADERLRNREPEIWHGLSDIREEIRATPELLARIRRKYRIKNTVGYGLNALLDFDRPIDILAHLLIGSEGTLAFIAEAVLNTVPILPHKLTALLVFDNLHAAAEAVRAFRNAGARAIELMDAAALRAVTHLPGMEAIGTRLDDRVAALLVEFQEADADALGAAEVSAARALGELGRSETDRFTRDPELQERWWRIREGLYPAVAVPRPSGTTAIIEDVAFPPERLAEAALDLQGLFRRHGYADAILFGHAKDGNFHFVLNADFNRPATIRQYDAFMSELVELVVTKHQGSLKGEHGTGRNMAPFVEAEWGAQAAAIMRRVKRLCDPEGLLNPGVIINGDPQAHLRDLKSAPPIEPEVDRCIECGYCERVCPSRELTLTPRQRIAVRRELARLHVGSGLAERRLLAADFEYAGVQTCAGDGACVTVCPMKINTGDLIKRFRHEGHSPAARQLALLIARNARLCELLIRGFLNLGHRVQSVVGLKPLTGLTRLMRRVFGPESIPLWLGDTPRAAGPIATHFAAGDAEYVYFPTCISRIFWHSARDQSDSHLPTALQALARRAGVALHTPSDIAGSCCGMPWQSKGFGEAQWQIQNRMIEKCWRWSGGGRLPIVVDGSSCTLGLRECRAHLDADNQPRFDRLRFLDSIEFAHDVLLPRLGTVRKLAAVALHPVCSVVQMGLVRKFETLGRAIAAEAFIPPDAECCGMAGDRGFLHPELTAAATRREAAAIRARQFDAYLSSNRTCEIALTRATGRPYRSIIQALEECTRA